MKKDVRKLDRKAQEAIRLMAVERVRGGESPSAVIGSYGMNRTIIHKWLNRISRVAQRKFATAFFAVLTTKRATSDETRKRRALELNLPEKT